jgi:hypothetical protein
MQTVTSAQTLINAWSFILVLPFFHDRLVNFFARSAHNGQWLLRSLLCKRFPLNLEPSRLTAITIFKHRQQGKKRVGCICVCSYEGCSAYANTWKQYKYCVASQQYQRLLAFKKTMRCFMQQSKVVLSRQMVESDAREKMLSFYSVYQRQIGLVHVF